MNLAQLLRILRGHYQGVGGAGDEPFLYGVGGAGELPFLHGVGGAGDEPFAIIMELLPCAITMVFKPIAPTNTIMTRSTTASFLDIMPPGMENTRRQSIPYCRDVK
jgi:hypothetical protein